MLTFKISRHQNLSIIQLIQLQFHRTKQKGTITDSNILQQRQNCKRMQKYQIIKIFFYSVNPAPVSLKTGGGSPKADRNQRLSPRSKILAIISFTTLPIRGS